MTNAIGLMLLLKDKVTGKFEARYEKFNGSLSDIIETFCNLQEYYEVYEIGDLKPDTQALVWPIPPVKAAKIEPQSTIEPAPTQTSPQKGLEHVEAPSESKEVYPDLKYRIRLKDDNACHIALNSQLAWELTYEGCTKFESRMEATVALNEFLDRDQPYKGFWRRDEFEIIGDFYGT